MSRKILGGVDNSGQRGINFADGVSPSDAATKQQLDNVAAGQAWKQPVRAASTVNVTLASGVANGSALDGVTLATGDRVLLKNQTAGAENGIYTVNASGAPTRGTDADTAAELVNATVYVRQGSTQADQAFVQTVDPITLGTTALTWAQTGGGVAYTAGNGLTLSGTSFSVTPKAGGGIVVDGTGVSIDPSYSGAVKRWAADVPASASAVMTHSLGTVDRVGEPLLIVKGTGEVVEGDITLGVNADTITFATAPTAGFYRYSTAA